ncbi:hypothetical protein NYE54_32005 [Paenibacillus sp. FSL K6-1330]|uniref:hypothetical protein n=1 Tax=Paenibacillus sp. FSL K6-1330 TaxID=2975292 RepID=UPI0030DB1AB1
MIGIRQVLTDEVMCRLDSIHADARDFSSSMDIVQAPRADTLPGVFACYTADRFCVFTVHDKKNVYRRTLTDDRPQLDEVFIAISGS